MIPGLDAMDEALEAEIRGRLDGVEDALDKAVEADSDVLGTTAGYLLAAGGKRFRPMLVLLAGYFGDPTDPRLIPGAAAIELTHVATLYHDDVMDEAASRHGVASVNARWDNTIAILTGDFLFARSSELAADLGPDVCRLLAQTIAILCDGQIRDVASAGDVDKTEQDHLEVIRRKTGVLIASSCRMGGMLSDADARRPRDAGGLRRVARAGVPAVGRHHGHHVDPARAGQGARHRHPRGRLHDARCCTRCARARTATSSGGSSRPGRPTASCLTGRSRSSAAGGAVEHARAGVAAEVTRAVGLARRLPEGHAQHALVQLARFLAVRCGAEVEDQEQPEALLGYGRAGEGADGS